jgi:signal transduction histidine kinase
MQDRIVWLVTFQPCPVTDASSEQEPSVAAGVFTDPRTPLEVVLGWTSLLQHDGGGPARVEYALGVIERNATREMHVIEDLLEVMRPSCTARPARRQPVDLRPLVKSAIDDAQPLAATRRVHLSLTSGSEDLATTGNDVQLRCAVSNLIVNAVTGLGPGGAVICGLWKSARWVGLVVGGTGERAGADEGHGLGLLVAREVAEMHGGVVTTTTPRIAHDAAFTLLLPRAGLPGRQTRDLWMAAEAAVSRTSGSVGPPTDR